MRTLSFDVIYFFFFVLAILLILFGTVVAVGVWFDASCRDHLPEPGHSCNAGAQLIVVDRVAVCRCPESK